MFDEHGTARKSSGSKGGRVFRNADNPDEVIVLLEWDDLQKARQFSRTQDLPQAMERAGVAGRPDIYFLDDAGRTAV